MTRRDTAREVLKAGGFFRNALEAHWRGGEKFRTRLKTAKGHTVPGIGEATRREMEKAGEIERRPTHASSSWPTEWAWVGEI